MQTIILLLSTLLLLLLAPHWAVAKPHPATPSGRSSATAAKSNTVTVALPPSVELPPDEEETTKPVSTASAPPPAPSPAAAASPKTPHELKSVRLRPLADSLRLIFQFDTSAPYALREDLDHQRAELDLINTHLSYLPPELAHVKDPRLSGIWLKESAPGLVTLEIRFPSAKMRIEHFAMDDPAAIVVDIIRTDTSSYIPASEETRVDLPKSVPASTLTPTPALPPAATPEPALSTPTPVLPPTLEAATPPSTEPPRPALSEDWLNASTPESSTAQSTATQSAAPPPDEPPPVAHLEVKAPAPKLKAEEATSSPSLGRQDVQPIGAEYDYFPVQAIHAASPQAKEIFDDFLAHRWATVIDKGVAFLKSTKIGDETSSMLFMMAEARWQLGQDRSEMPVQDMMNYYDQALRTDSGSDLGAFGNWRQAELFYHTQDYDSAIDSVNRALSSTDKQVRQRALLLKVQALTAKRAYDDALALIAKLQGEVTKLDTRVELFTREGTIRMTKGDAPGAWAAFQKANQLDPQWINLDVDACENMARAAMETGHLDQARSYIEYITKYFTHRDDDKRMRLLLLFAEVQTRQGDIKSAEESYATILSSLRDSERGNAIMKQMMMLESSDLIKSESQYCMLLWRRGKVNQAMRELNRSYQDCLRGGLTADQLQAPIESIVPTFMDFAVRTDRPFEAVSAWRTFAPLIKNPAARRRCLIPLAEALEKLKFPREALGVIRQIKALDPPPADASLSDPCMSLQEARLNLALGQPVRAIPILERLLGKTSDPTYTMEACEQLSEAYKQNNQPLEAAQAYQSLANTPGIAATRRGTALLKAGEIFMQRSMPVQAVEIGLKSLIFEKEVLDQNKGNGWDAQTGSNLRLMLARAYTAREDYARARIILGDLLRRPALSAEDKAQARLMLGDGALRLGHPQEALQIYQQTDQDDATPPLWKNAARDRLKTFDWDRDHPQWTINSAAPLGRP